MEKFLQFQNTKIIIMFFIGFGTIFSAFLVNMSEQTLKHQWVIGTGRQRMTSDIGTMDGQPMAITLTEDFLFSHVRWRRIVHPKPVEEQSFVEIVDVQVSVFWIRIFLVCFIFSVGSICAFWLLLIILRLDLVNRAMLSILR